LVSVNDLTGLATTQKGLVQPDITAAENAKTNTATYKEKIDEFVTKI